MTKPTKKNQPVLALLTLLISTTLCYFIAEYFLSWYNGTIANSSKMQPGLMRYHPQLGWTLSPSWQGKHKHFDFDVSYSTNSLGLRNDGSNKTLLPHLKTRPRTALVGDSFTFGFGANDDETFHALLNQSDANTEYLNFGIPGFSTDQQYLLIKQYGEAFRIDHYVLIFYLGNDILDNALPFPLQASRGKPYFSLQQGQLKLNNSPVSREPKTALLLSTTLDSIIFGEALKQYSGPLDNIIQSSQLLSLLAPQSARIAQGDIDKILQQRLQQQEQLLSALLATIKTTTNQHNSQLTLALLPGRSFVAAPDSYSAYFQDYVRRSAMEIANKIDIPVIDVAQQLATQTQTHEPWFHPNEGHLTPAGHRQVASILKRHIGLNQPPASPTTNRQPPNPAQTN